jgi:hypothetical protein
MGGFRRPKLGGNAPISPTILRNLIVFDRKISKNMRE